MLLSRQARQGRLTGEFRRIDKGYAEQNITKKEYRIHRDHQGASLSLTNCLTEHPPQISVLPKDTLGAPLSSALFSLRRGSLHEDLFSTEILSPRRSSLFGETLHDAVLSAERVSPRRTSPRSGSLHGALLNLSLLS
jgi:hypothetical protein